MSKQCSFEVIGTKCASCELIIERELKKIQGVRTVCVSHKDASICLEVNDEKELTADDLEAVLKEHGYRVGPAREGRAPLQLNLKRLGGIIVTVFALYYLLSRTGFLTYSPSVEGPSSLLAVFTIGLIAAFSSCTAVVGGLIAGFAATKAKANEHLGFAKKMAPHLLFNVGRLVGFTVLGALIGWVGQSLSLSTTVNGFFILVIAVIMLLLGINLVGVFSRSVFAVRPPRFLARRVHDLSKSKNPFIPFIAGAGTFFLPCGFTQSMQLYALSLGDPKTAALTMGVFALGTLPALLGIGAITSAAKGHILKKITSAAGALVIVLGISNIRNAAALLDLNIIPTTQAVSERAPVIIEGAEQVVTMNVSTGGYQPSTLTVVAGTPVRWDINGSNSMGCAGSLVMRAFNVSTRLKPGLNTVRFTPTKAGTYTFSCSMGMYRGTMIVTPAA
ncbi:MAG: sulfite exporter TauE/SafE family protein [Parcubacteria group bacterium]|nr:sulfite exporter TauE/SafE family protein [Parcubacteria group bacterium]